MHNKDLVYYRKNDIATTYFTEVISPLENYEYLILEKPLDINGFVIKNSCKTLIEGFYDKYLTEVTFFLTTYITEMFVSALLL